MVRLTREQTGRGPNRARTYITPEIVTVLLEDTLTKAEHSLVRQDNGRMVLEVRRAHQEAMREAMVAGVETILGCRVLAMLSSNSVDPDYSVENFVLDHGGARGARGAA